MNLPSTLQQAIEEIASSQGITPEQFITQTLIEKIRTLQSHNSAVSTTQTGLTEKDGILVFETESLDHIDFNALIAQSRQERDPEQINL